MHGPLKDRFTNLPLLTYDIFKDTAVEIITLEKQTFDKINPR